MAENASGRRRRGSGSGGGGGGGEEKPQKEPVPTSYVIGEMVTAQYTPTKVQHAQLHDDGSEPSPIITLAFVPLLDDDGKPKRVFADTQEEAIGMHAGTVEGSKLIGNWKAISWTAWKGLTVNPPPELKPSQKSQRVEDE